jgi:hypothetical protein
MSFVSMFVFLLQLSFSSTDPHIFLPTLGALLTAVVVVQAADPNVGVGRIRVLYSCNSEN